MAHERLIWKDVIHLRNLDLDLDRERERFEPFLLFLATSWPAFFNAAPFFLLKYVQTDPPMAAAANPEAMTALLVFDKPFNICFFEGVNLGLSASMVS